jgi:hypothetical protein
LKKKNEPPQSKQSDKNIRQIEIDLSTVDDTPSTSKYINLLQIFVIFIISLFRRIQCVGFFSKPCLCGLIALVTCLAIAAFIIPLIINLTNSNRKLQVSSKLSFYKLAGVPGVARENSLLHA